MKKQIVISIVTLIAGFGSLLVPHVAMARWQRPWVMSFRSLSRPIFQLIQPDLTIEAFSLDAYWNGGGSIEFVVVNSGSGTASETTVRILETTRPAGCPDEWEPQEFASFDIPGLSPGAEYQLSTVLAESTLPEGLSSCQIGRTFEAVVDPDNLIRESNEENNTMSSNPFVFEIRCSVKCGGSMGPTCGVQCVWY